MNFDKESKSRKIFLGVRMGKVVTGGMNMTAAIFCTHDTLSRPLLQNRIES